MVLWSVAYNYDFPQSVLDAYDANEPGDCTKSLGAECVRALQRTPITVESVFDGMDISAPECSDVFGKLVNELPDFSILSPNSKSLAACLIRNIKTVLTAVEMISHPMQLIILSYGWHPELSVVAIRMLLTMS